MESLIIFGARHLTVVMILIALLFSWRLSDTKKREMAIFAVITLPLIYLMGKLASLLYFNPRPFVVENFTPLVAHAADNGFPSEHTLLSAAVAALVYFFSKKLGALLFVLALLVGAARVLAGVHHALDVTGSIIIAFGVALFIFKYILPVVLNSKCYRKFK
jgi:undecaprenyl-diphosphatase